MAIILGKMGIQSSDELLEIIEKHTDKNRQTAESYFFTINAYQECVARIDAEIESLKECYQDYLKTFGKINEDVDLDHLYEIAQAQNKLKEIDNSLMKTLERYSGFKDKIVREVSESVPDMHKHIEEVVNRTRDIKTIDFER